LAVIRVARGLAATLRGATTRLALVELTLCFLTAAFFCGPACAEGEIRAALTTAKPNIWKKRVIAVKRRWCIRVLQTVKGVEQCTESKKVAQDQYLARLSKKVIQL
jgi:hypothetical protein